MIRKLARITFLIYQGTTRSQNATCRFSPTCSQYAVEAIEKYGFLKGSQKAISRVLSCHPFTKRPIYDPVA